MDDRNIAIITKTIQEQMSVLTDNVCKKAVEIGINPNIAMKIAAEVLGTLVLISNFENYKGGKENG